MPSTEKPFRCSPRGCDAFAEMFRNISVRYGVGIVRSINSSCRSMRGSHSGTCLNNEIAENSNRKLLSVVETILPATVYPNFEQFPKASQKLPSSFYPRFTVRINYYTRS